MTKVNRIDLNGHYSIANVSNVQKIVTPLKSAFNIKHFRYLKLYSNGQRLLLSNNEDCIRFTYEEGNYTKMWFDGEYPENIKEGWHIWDIMRTVNSDGLISSFEREINQVLNLYHGLTLVVKGLGFYEIYTFDSDGSKIYQTDKRILSHFIFYFKEQAKKLIMHGEGEKISIQSKYPKSNICTQQNDEFNSILKNMRINRYYLGGKYDGVYLTAKELQCANWLIQGKSIDEISMIEGNSIKTVGCHLENIRRKLNCNKQTQLVRIILESGIIRNCD